MKIFARVVRQSLLLVIAAYQYLISPCLSRHCRFYPSCSEYARLALNTHGVAHGLFYTARRLLRCNPWHKGGFDPIPPLS